MDQGVYRDSAKFIDAVVKEAKRRGLASSYIYMNYASPYQAVVDGYGSANLKRLRQVADVYDPAQVFQTLQPGGFKLGGAPFGTAP